MFIAFYSNWWCVQPNSHIINSTHHSTTVWTFSLSYAKVKLSGVFLFRSENEHVPTLRHICWLKLLVPTVIYAKKNTQKNDLIIEFYSKHFKWWTGQTNDIKQRKKKEIEKFQFHRDVAFVLANGNKSSEKHSFFPSVWLIKRMDRFWMRLTLVM